MQTLNIRDFWNNVMLGWFHRAQIVIRLKRVKFKLKKILVCQSWLMINTSIEVCLAYDFILMLLFPYSTFFITTNEPLIKFWSTVGQSSRSQIGVLAQFLINLFVCLQWQRPSYWYYCFFKILFTSLILSINTIHRFECTQDNYYKFDLSWSRP